jgi:hypothetical protein
MDEGYDTALGMLQKTVNEIGIAGVSKSEIFSALTDVAVMLALIIGGETGAYAMIENMKERVEYFKPADPVDDDLPPHPREA